MHINATIQYGIRTAVVFLNQPIVKESVKRIASIATFIFGLIEIYDIYQIMRGKEIATDIDPNKPQWVQTAAKVSIVFAKISIILSAAISRPGVYIISTLVNRVATQAQLERLFGPNTIYAHNPWHPRHVASIAAVILAVPAMVQAVYLGFSWVSRKVDQLQEDNSEINQNHAWLTDAKIRLIVLFNTLTSRPVLHIGNQFARRFI